MVARVAVAAGSTQKSRKHQGPTIMTQRIARDATLRNAWRFST
jgi:hypothetical protein